MMTRSGLFIASKATQKYRKQSAPFWVSHKDAFKAAIEGKPKPIFIGLHFIRGSRRNWDFINPAQTIQDEMVKAGWIEDDNVLEILPVPLFVAEKYWSYSKDNPGVIIAVLDSLCDEIPNPITNETIS